VRLAAGDDATRQRCVRVIQAASAGGASSSLHHISSAVAVTGELLKMKSLPAVNAVMTALGKAKVKGLDVPSFKAAGLTLSDFKAAGFDPKSLQSAGYDVLSLIADFGYDAVASSGCDVSSILVTSPPAPPSTPHPLAAKCTAQADNRTAPQTLDLTPCNPRSSAPQRQPLRDAAYAPS
jgi:hypothetical protein